MLRVIHEEDQQLLVLLKGLEDRWV